MPEDTLRYIKLDYASQRDALIQRVRSRYPDVWNDFLNGDFGTLFLDLMAWTLSTGAFTVNRLAAENFISTMQLRESAVRMGSLVGYKLKSPSPAIVSCQATLLTPAPAEVVIQKGKSVRTGDTALVFEVAQDYTIAEGETTPLSVVVTFDPEQSGTGVIQSLVQVTEGDPNVDLLDPSIDLTEFVEPGQRFRLAAGDPEYEIVSVESAPDAVARNRLVLATDYAGASAATTAQVIDRNIQLVQGQTISERTITPGTTRAFYAISLSRSPVINGSVTVSVNNVMWQAVDSIFLADRDQQAFEVRQMDTGEMKVLFGDGNFGEVMAAEAELIVTYRVGGGTAGNIPAGAISAGVVGLIPSLSNPVNIQLENTQPGQGGLDAETLEEARVNIPAFTRTNDRAVTLDDYQTLASTFADPEAGQVRYARAALRSENATLEGNIVVIYAWTSGDQGTLTPVRGALKAALLDYMQSKAVGTDLVVLADGETQPLPIAMRFKALPGYTVEAVTVQVNATLLSYVRGLRPGAPVILSDLTRALDETTGVDSLIIATPTNNLFPPTNEVLFIAPDEDFDYSLALRTIGTEGTDTYTATLPVFPLAAWSFSMTLADAPLSVSPDAEPGYARLSGAGLSDDPDLPSRVNLLTGTITLYTTGVPGDLKLRLKPVQGYERERTVSLYIGYRAQSDSSVKRREIRAALQAWIGGFPPGATIFAEQIDGVPPSAANVSAVVLAVDGVTEVTRVSFDSASNPSRRLDVAQVELLRFSAIYLNNLAN